MKSADTGVQDGWRVELHVTITDSDAASKFKRRVMSLYA